MDKLSKTNIEKDLGRLSFLNFPALMVVETDRIPRSILHKSDDWSGLAFGAFLASPLIREAPARGITNGLIGKLERLSELDWRVQFEEGSVPRNCVREVAVNLNQVGRSRNVATPLTTHLRKVVIESTDCLHITTRFPIAHLARLLANPIYGLPLVGCSDPGLRLFVSKHTSEVMHIRDANYRSIKIIAHSSRNLIGTGTVDISGPMTSAFLHCGEGGPFRAVCHSLLDLFYVLEIPAKIDRRDAHAIREALQPDMLRPGLDGVLRPTSSFTETWNYEEVGERKYQQERVVPCSRDQTRERFQIRYAPYTGNREVAQVVAQQVAAALPIELIPTPVKYESLLAERSQQGEFRVLVAAALWPHPAAMLTGFYHSGTASDQFCDMYRRSLAVENLQEAQRLAAAAERLLTGALRQVVVLGRAIGSIWSKKDPGFLPPSGWYNFLG